MINLSLNVSNPWSKQFKNLWNRCYSTPFNNKFIELEVCRDDNILSFMFRLATRQSHSGLSLELGIVGYSFSLNFYDNRHWNYEAGRYYEYNEE